MKQAVFLDRDGVLNKEKHYICKWQDFEWLEGVEKSLVALKKAGFLLIVTTNQSGIARGYYNSNAVETLHAQINDSLFAKWGIKLDAFYYCPHHPDYTGACSCRKPLPGMLFQAMTDFNINPVKSFLIGDKKSDIDAAIAANIMPVLVLSGYGKTEAEKLKNNIPVCNNFKDACNFILNLQGKETFYE